MDFDVLPLPFPARTVDAVFSELFPQADSEAAEVFVRQVRRAVLRGEEITLGSAAAANTC